MQPISEQGENTKDDTTKVDDSNTNLTAEDPNENRLESSEVREQERLELNNEQLENSYNENNSLKSKEDYSACIKLIEKFQEAVLENAVRVIQAAFKRFRERRRFLKLRKAATVIQRSVRRWLKMKHSCERSKLQLAIKGDSEQNSEMQRNCTTSVEMDGEVALADVESDIEEEESELMGERFDGVTDDRFDHEGLTEDKDRAVQFENSFESLDASSLCGSADNISDACEGIDQIEDTSPVSDPDTLSLADSGIDMCSDSTIEAAIPDDCKCSYSESPLPASSDMLLEETTSE